MKGSVTRDDRQPEKWQYRDRLRTSAGYRSFKRRGFNRKKDGEAFQTHVYQLVDLARGDPDAEARIGDLIFQRTKRGGQLPAVDDVRRRLGLGRQQLAVCRQFWGG
jgi:hypothetical protein